MKNIAIWGAGEIGRSVRAEFPLEDGERFCCFVDNHPRNAAELPCIRPSEFAQRFGEDIDAVFVAVRSYYDLGDILFELHELGIRRDIFALKSCEWGKRRDGIHSADHYLWGGNIAGKAVITKLEFHVCDHCNLNCAGCSHFAPIYQNSFADIEAFDNDMARLAEDFYILRLRLMGGEPLLNSEFPAFIGTARKHFPHARLEIVTNGLLLPDVPMEFIESMAKHDAFLNISLYPPTFKIREKIEKRLEGTSIGYSFGSGLEQYNDAGVIEEFHQCFTERRTHDSKIAASHCFGAECHYLRNGKISKCALPLLAADINRYFGKHFEVSGADYVDIYDDTETPWDKVRHLREASPFCGYCSEGGARRFPWQVKREVVFEDYVKPK